MEWSYYDLVSDFDVFKAAWDTPVVQRQLEEDLSEWCDADGLPRWKRGNPIWNLYKDGVDDQWDDIIDERAAERTANLLHVEKNAAKYFQASMSRACGKTYRDPDSAIFEMLHSRLLEECRPRPDSYESLVLIGGDYCLTNALFKTAALLYPDDPIEVRGVGPHDAIVLPDRGLVIDILGFFYWYELGDEDFAPENLYFSDSDSDEEGDYIVELEYHSQDESMRVEVCTCDECTYFDDEGVPGLF